MYALTYRCIPCADLSDKQTWSWGCLCLSSLGGSQPTDYKRNEKLDQKISLYNGDITKLEIDAIVNAGMCVCLCLNLCEVVYVHTGQNQM